MKKKALEPETKLEKLGSISSKVKKGIFQILASEYKQKGVPFVRVSDIKNMTIDMSEITHISEESNEKEKKTSFKPRSIVVSKGGTIGRTAIIPHFSQKFNISQDIIGISIKTKSEVEPEYVTTFLMSKLGKLQMERIKTQQMQPHLTLEHMKKLRILYRMSDHKEIVDKIKTAERMNLESYVRISKALTLFYDALGVVEGEQPRKWSKTFQISSNKLSTLLTPRFYHPKYSHLLTLAKERFKTSSLKKLVVTKIKKGNEVGSKNYRSYLEKSKSSIPFIRTSDIVNWEIDTYPDYYVSEEIDAEINQDIRPEDILFTKDGKIGFVGLVTEADRSIVSSGFAILRMSPGVRHYAFLVLTSELGFSQAWQRTVIASTIPHLQSPERLGEIEIPFVEKSARQQIEKLVREAFELKTIRKKTVSECLGKIEQLIS